VPRSAARPAADVPAARQARDGQAEQQAADDHGDGDDPRQRGLLMGLLRAGQGVVPVHAEGAAIAPDEVLPTVVRTVRGALRLPYAAVTLSGEARPAATDGEPAQAVAELPLRHAGTEVGRLTVGLRDGQRFLDPGDERLLQGFAQQAGIAADSVRLTHDLRRSRDELAVARDEERHRIRRDLHDGLGPTLAGVALGLGAARRPVAAGVAETAELLASMETEVKESLADVKRLVADLRPTTLEELGLAEALRRYADTVTQRSEGTLKVRVELAALPPLSPGAEVAAYRIILEAVTTWPGTPGPASAPWRSARATGGSA
jgi:two-component system, NarL family, sensor kinase